MTTTELIDQLADLVFFLFTAGGLAFIWFLLALIQVGDGTPNQPVDRIDRLIRLLALLVATAILLLLGAALGVAFCTLWDILGGPSLW